MIPWHLDWIINWNESPPIFLKWIIIWIEFWSAIIESDIELKQILLKFKHWIESNDTSFQTLFTLYLSFAIESYDTNFFFWDSFPMLGLTFPYFKYCWRIRNCHHAPFDRQARAKLRIHTYIWMFLKYSNPSCIWQKKIR